MSKIIFSLVVLGLIPSAALAQITPDSSLGAENSVVESNGNRDTIQGGAVRDANLFHSFQEFNVGVGREAFFSNPSGIANIFSRVTGNNLSNIQGVLGVLGNANLFLINPNGIIFGANARLDLNGSFVGATADSILFDNFEFSASNPQSVPLITINIPIGLGFRDNPGDINLAGNLAVDPRQSLDLIGGNVNLDNGQINSPGSNIYLGSVKETGIVNLDTNFTPNIPEDLIQGDISIVNDSSINVRGNGNGSISIEAHNLELNFSGLRAGIAENSGSLDTISGDIKLNIQEQTSLRGGSVISNAISEGSQGNIGDIEIETNSLNLAEASQINILNFFGQGTIGDINIQAESVSIGQADIDGDLSGIYNQTGGIGSTGNININTKSLTVNNQSELNTGTFSQGDAGDINIDANTVIIDNSFIFNSVVESAEGDGGNVNINANNFELFNSQIILDSGGIGNAANINIDANIVELNNSQIFASIIDTGIGKAGDVSINANQSLILDNDSLITVSLDDDNLNNDLLPQGGAGDINIDTDILLLNNDSDITTPTEGIGNAGNINIKANSITINNGRLSSSVFSTGVGNGGEINIETNSLQLIHQFTAANAKETQAIIFANSGGEGNAGNINIIAKDNISLDGYNAGISSGVISTTNIGNGGDINLETNSLELTNGATITSIVSSQVGDSGKINIIADNYIKLEGLIGSKGEIYFGSIGNPTGFSNQGNTATINIETGSLDLFYSDISSTVAGDGQSGGITINVDNDIKLDGSFSNGIFTNLLGIGKAGDIIINAKTLELNNGVQISSSTVGNGDAGNINLNIQDKIVLNRFSGIFSDDLRSGVGNGGDINIDTTSLFMTDLTTITSKTSGEGTAGDINLNITEKLELSNAEILANTTDNSTGDGGDIEVTAKSTLLIDDSVIGVNSLGTGDAGNVDFTTENLTLENNSLISAETTAGEGGNLAFNLTEALILDNSAITTEAGGTGNGGNITAKAQFIILKDSDIIANAFEGDGGRIDLTIQGLFTSLGSNISASSRFGIDGIIAVNTPEVDPSQGVVELPQTVVDPNQLIAENACKQGGDSQFYLTGRGGLPPSPDGNLDTNKVSVDLIQPVTTNSSSSRVPNQNIELNEENIPTSKSIVPARGWIKNERGEIVLVDYDTNNIGNGRNRESLGNCNRK